VRDSLFIRGRPKRDVGRTRINYREMLRVRPGGRVRASFLSLLFRGTRFKTFDGTCRAATYAYVRPRETGRLMFGDSSFRCPPRRRRRNRPRMHIRTTMYRRPRTCSPAGTRRTIINNERCFTEPVRALMDGKTTRADNPCRGRPLRTEPRQSTISTNVQRAVRTNI